ncbi:MAG: hypothetical protein P4L35_01215, partial [Ignavibacteriaceae bacterium]|nr:hypothetical protein [Ignavibacteriaceae bacterium]
MRYFLVLIVALLFTVALDAQVHVNINLDSQPVWGPTGYDYVENYYFPDVEGYYNVPTHHYYYNQNGRWISSSTLPARYGKLDLYKAHKVVINDKQPWKNHAANRDKYASFKGQHDQ